MKKQRKMDDQTFNAMAQLAVLKVIAQRVYELEKLIDKGLDPDANWIELDYLRAFCFGEFSLSYMTLPEMAGDTIPRQAMIDHEQWLELWHSVCADYQPFNTNR